MWDKNSQRHQFDVWLCHPQLKTIPATDMGTIHCKNVFQCDDRSMLLSFFACNMETSVFYEERYGCLKLIVQCWIVRPKSGLRPCVLPIAPNRLNGIGLCTLLGYRYVLYAVQQGTRAAARRPLPPPRKTKFVRSWVPSGGPNEFHMAR